MQFRGDLLAASKFDMWCVPVKVEAGFGYSRLEQDHNFNLLVNNQPSTTFRINDHLDTDYYNVIGGLTAYHRIGEKFEIMGGTRLGLGVARSTISGLQSFGGNDFSQDASRDAFSVDVRGSLGFDYRVMPGLRLGMTTYIDYLNEAPKAAYPSATGQRLRLESGDALRWGVDFKLRYSFN